MLRNEAARVLTTTPSETNLMHTQNHANYPHARSASEQDIFAAAESRAKFWRYRPQGPWTVYVTVGKRTVTVHKDSEGNLSIAR